MKPMIEVTHRPGVVGWEFHFKAGGLHGGGRSLQASIETADHAVRHYLSERAGYDVRPEEASSRTRHICGGEPPEVDRAPAGGRTRQLLPY